MRISRGILALSTLTGLLACGFATPRAAPMADRIPLLEVRLAYFEAAPDLERVEYDGQALFLASDPVISDVDLTTVQPSVNRERLILRLRCTAEASERMKIATGQHIDQPIVILFAGEVRAAPIVRGPVGCTETMMALPAFDEEAEQMADKVRERWPEQGL